MRKRFYFTKEERISIANEYYTTDASSKEICQKYGISSHTVLCNWVKKYVKDMKIPEKVLPLSHRPASRISAGPSSDMAITSKETKELKSRIAELEKALKWEQMRSHALETMIEIAEEQGMKVRKKSGAK